jgi:fructose-1,6-bisphosphatase I
MISVVKHTATSVVTIDRFIIEEERNHPEATGELSGILYDLALAAKMIANKVRSAGLADILGATEDENVQGGSAKLDVLANEIITKAMDHDGRLCAMASEEEPGIIQIPEMFKCGKYCLLFDPLDGSSNIDVNVPVGTIFSVVKKITRGRHGELEDMLQPGRRQVAAGYVIYGSSTMMVYTTGQGAHGFTLDPSIGEFLLSHPNIRTPDAGRYLSVNDSYEQLWDENVRAVMRQYKGLDGDRRALSTRYVGSLVADFHRNPLGGGIFAYPANKKTPKGKLRLLYEANPLAFIVEQAGGFATDGSQSILNIEPTKLHQRPALHWEQERSRSGATDAASGARAGAYARAGKQPRIARIQNENSAKDPSFMLKRSGCVSSHHERLPNSRLFPAVPSTVPCKLRLNDPSRWKPVKAPEHSTSRQHPSYTEDPLILAMHLVELMVVL